VSGVLMTLLNSQPLEMVSCNGRFLDSALFVPSGQLTQTVNIFNPPKKLGPPPARRHRAAGVGRSRGLALPLTHRRAEAGKERRRPEPICPGKD
jgi:hypothetical protein